MGAKLERINRELEAGKESSLFSFFYVARCFFSYTALSSLPPSLPP